MHLNESPDIQTCAWVQTLSLEAMPNFLAGNKSPAQKLKQTSTTYSL